jgi:hypothetical protein
MSVVVFWVETLYGLVGGYQRSEEHYTPEDGGSMFLRNVCIHLQVHTASKPRGHCDNKSPKDANFVGYFLCWIL